MKRFLKIFLIPAVLLLILGLTCGIYIADDYPADGAALEAMASEEDISVQIREDMVVFSPALPRAGFIFYPGGKVEHRAYAPLMKALARQDILCVLISMPGNLAVLDMDAAEDVPGQFPEISRWFIGGHSLGGSMAASYASKHPGHFEGLALLAAYSTADLSGSGLKVISLYGTEDGVLNLEKYEKYRSNLPENTVESIIQGGNHALFGSYGPQEGDGIAKITPEEQITQTVQQLQQFFAE